MERKRLTESIKTAKAWGKVHLKMPIINEATGFSIEITSNGIEHSLKHDLMVDKSGKFIDLLFLIRHFKIIFKKAKFVESRLDKYGLEDKLKIHEFIYEFIYKGKTEKLQIIIKEITFSDKNILKNQFVFYNHRFMTKTIKKP